MTSREPQPYPEHDEQGGAAEPRDYPAESGVVFEPTPGVLGQQVENPYESMIWDEDKERD